VEEKKFNLILGDCLVEMETLISNGIKVDMILCDLPYGTTACAWDAVIPFEQLWSCYKRLIKENGAIALFGSQPFTTDLINSNRAWFKYEIIWEKQKGSNPLLADKQILKAHENIIVFCKGQPTYNPQFEKGKPYIRKGDCSVKSENWGGEKNKVYDLGSENGNRYPKSVQKFTSEGMNSNNLHPTQKPIELMKWLVATYSNKDELVLDNTMGSGTTGLGCMIMQRRFIGIEKEQEYFTTAERRISAEANQIKLF
jgi:site-specific DNA-methyltransferase (adenine-specific)